MYFEDLTFYSYYKKEPFRNVLNVGWLDAAHKYAVKEPNTDFIKKLANLVANEDGCNAHVNKIRGLHPCNICGKDVVTETVFGQPILLGASEIWVPFESGWYASPSMVLHYVFEHHYGPPDQFIDAVSKMDLDVKYCGQDIYDKLCIEQASKIKN
jgi:hypothetical protein